MRRRGGSPAYFITYNILGLRKGGIVGRYLCVLLTISVTGLFHIWIDVGFGVPWYESGSLHFFALQSVGIMIEDAVQTLSQSMFGDKLRRESLLFSVLGYIWVLSWMAWSMPIWIYPTIQRNAGIKLLPISFIGLFLAG